MRPTWINTVNVIKVSVRKPEDCLAPILLSCCIALAGSHIPFRGLASACAHGIACRFLAVLVALCVATSPCRLWRGDLPSPSWLPCMLCKCAQLATGVSSFMSHKCLKHNRRPEHLAQSRTIGRSHEPLALLAVQ